jgi:hypothetical protein
MINFHSDDIKELCVALVNAQKEMPIAHSNQKGHFKGGFADIIEVFEVSRPILVKNGLAISQQLVPAENGTILQTMLIHTSGQWIKSQVLLSPLKQDMTALGAYITYYRRYSYAAIVGLVAEKDDDGAAITKAEEGYKRIDHTKPEYISKEEKDYVEKLLGHFPAELINQFKAAMRINYIYSLRKDQYQSALKWINDNK